jgi:hypothetical protein
LFTILWGAQSDADSQFVALSQKADIVINACNVHVRLCIADALDGYAAALQQIVPQLSPGLRSLPLIVATAARKVRAARTMSDAVRAVKTAITQIRKSIELLKADDPATIKQETREGTLVVETLQIAGDKLEKAVGL